MINGKKTKPANTAKPTSATEIAQVKAGKPMVSEDIKITF
jgi:hypothetical protein